MKISSVCLGAVLVLADTARRPSRGGVTAFTPSSSVPPLTTTSLRQSASTPSTQLFAAAASSSAEWTDAQRVVVTGLGVISGCGIGADDFFQAVLDGKSSIGKVTRFDASNYPCQIASEVPSGMFVPEEHFANPKNARSNDRYTHFAVAAARQALKDAGIGDTPETLENPDRIGVMVGSAFGGMETFEQETLKLAKKPDRPKVRKQKLLCGDAASDGRMKSACHSSSHELLLHLSRR
jgi:Beta-ketoacyl synthase, N-terminal domain